MSTVRVIPCLDVLRGRVVKGLSFGSLRDVGDPVSLAAKYSNDGADEIVLLDIGAAPDDKSHATAILRKIRGGCNVPLTVGGGVRTLADASRLFAAGADKIALNSAAVHNPELITAIADKFGMQAVVTSIDCYADDQVVDTYLIRIRGGQLPVPRNAVNWALECWRRGAGEILLTSWNADGRRSGYDLNLIERITRKVPIPVIASGGAGNAGDMIAARRAGAHGLLAAGIFHDGIITITEIKEQLQAAGIAVRPSETPALGQKDINRC